MSASRAAPVSAEAPSAYPAGAITPVVLGILSWSENSGYEIKRIVDESARFIWAASYGQIYPELKRLAEAGLVESIEDPAGGRRRVIHRITPAGLTWLREWLAEPSETFEMRDDAVLRLLFSGAAPESAAATLASKRELHAGVADRLEAMRDTGRPSGMALLALSYGIECHRSMQGWCERTLGELGADPPATDLTGNAPGAAQEATR